MDGRTLVELALVALIFHLLRLLQNSAQIGAPHTDKVIEVFSRRAAA